MSEEAQGICASEDFLSAVNTKLDLLVSLKTNVDTRLTLPAKVDELPTLKPAVQCLQETVKTLQQSIDDLSLKYDSVLAKATENERTPKHCRSGWLRCAVLWTNNRVLSSDCRET